MAINNSAFLAVAQNVLRKKEFDELRRAIEAGNAEDKKTEEAEEKKVADKKRADYGERQRKGLAQNFMTGVASGMMASGHQQAKSMGAAMSGAMGPIYQDQEIEAERRRDEANQNDFTSMDAGHGFELAPPTYEQLDLIAGMQAKLGGGGNPVSTPSEPVVTAPQKTTPTTTTPPTTDTNGINSGVNSTTPAPSGTRQTFPEYGMFPDMPR